MAITVKEIYASKFGIAYRNYRTFTQSPANQNTLRRFRIWLGVGEDGTWDDFYKSDLAMNRVDWMSGPDAEIKYKIWRAKQA